MNKDCSEILFMIEDIKKKKNEIQTKMDDIQNNDTPSDNTLN